MILGLPQPWPGSDEERRANRNTHAFSGGSDGRCWRCDCRPGHIAADWPCGTEPPRVMPGDPPPLLVVPYAPLERILEADEPEPEEPTCPF